MELYIYLTIYIIFAVVYMLIRSVKGDEIAFKPSIIEKLPLIGQILIKIIPALLAALFVFLYKPNDSLFYIGLTIGLFFCMLGDIGMEISLIPGIGLFSIAQLTLAISFLGEGLSYGIIPLALVGGVVTIIVMAVYMIFFLRYLESSDKGLGKFKNPVLFYCVLISFMMVSSVILWLSVGTLEAVILPLGALIFVSSDSVIAIREFHHKMSFSAIKVMATYHLAILMFSLAIYVI